MLDVDSAYLDSASVVLVLVHQTGTEALHGAMEPLLEHDTHRVVHQCVQSSIDVRQEMNH